MNISTKLVYEAITYYSLLGYQMIDAPYVVDSASSDLTKPEGKGNLFHSKSKGKVYVASAEQSFIQLYSEGKLPDGKYMALTPCVRDEEVLDAEHYSVFLKLELIQIGSNLPKGELHPLDNMIIDCETFFEGVLDHKVDQSFCEDGLEFDLEFKGIELGSYGSRRMPDGNPYRYGTGLAEPRFSYALDKKRRLYN